MCLRMEVLLILNWNQLDFSGLSENHKHTWTQPRQASGLTHVHTRPCTVQKPRSDSNASGLSATRSPLKGLEKTHRCTQRSWGSLSSVAPELQRWSSLWWEENGSGMAAVCVRDSSSWEHPAGFIPPPPPPPSPSGRHLRLQPRAGGEMTVQVSQPLSKQPAAPETTQALIIFFFMAGKFVSLTQYLKGSSSAHLRTGTHRAPPPSSMFLCRAKKLRRKFYSGEATECR